LRKLTVNSFWLVEEIYYFAGTVIISLSYYECSRFFHFIVSEDDHYILGGAFMDKKIREVFEEGQKQIADAKTEQQLQNIKAALLGKSGSLTGLLKELPNISAEERPAVGKAINMAKQNLSKLIEEKNQELKLKAGEISSDFDYTAPGIVPCHGGLHPITQMCYDLNDAFRSMGFEIFQEDDITSEL
jgi:phenylalanyl-tRNA synthetase alpha chain